MPLSMLPFYHVDKELECPDGDEDGMATWSCQSHSNGRSLLHMAHGGHPGMLRMEWKLQEPYWWAGLDSQVEMAEFCLNFTLLVEQLNYIIQNLLIEYWIQISAEKLSS